jgi:hypothetical protein
MRCDLNSILSQIVADPILHARWLNTFSYLEFIGFRKIIKSQKSSFIDSKTLEHAIEEGRHALLLKKLAMKFGGNKFNSYSPDLMLCANQAARYFYYLDQACDAEFSQASSKIEQARLVYLCLTWLVEVRALSIYGLYRKTAKNAGINLPLSGLLAEEDSHLKSVEAEMRTRIPNFEVKVEELRLVEKRLYDDYLLAVFKELAIDAETVALHV